MHRTKSVPMDLIIPPIAYKPVLTKLDQIINLRYGVCPKMKIGKVGAGATLGPRFFWFTFWIPLPTSHYALVDTRGIPIS